MLSLEEIFQARNRLAPYVYHTPCSISALDPLLGCQVYVKAECMQLTHSFKIQGSFEPDPQLTPEERAEVWSPHPAGTTGGALPMPPRCWASKLR